MASVANEGIFGFKTL